jgi:hypothetical protein
MSSIDPDIRLTLASINNAWREGHPSSVLRYLHPDVTMALPGFKETLRGRDALIAGFEESCQNAKVIQYEESDESIDEVEDCAVATFRFKMTYERATYREISEGRDVWVFWRQDNRWVAVWRTMVDLTAERSSVKRSG